MQMQSTDWTQFWTTWARVLQEFDMSSLIWRNLGYPTVDVSSHMIKHAKFFYYNYCKDVRTYDTASSWIQTGVLRVFSS